MIKNLYGVCVGQTVPQHVALFGHVLSSPTKPCYVHHKALISPVLATSAQNVELSHLPAEQACSLGNDKDWYRETHLVGVYSVTLSNSVAVASIMSPKWRNPLQIHKAEEVCWSGNGSLME